MDPAEFRRRVPVLIDGFMSRIPPEFQRGITWEIDGGEHGRAVDNIVGLIVDHHIPVTVDEREQLRDMLGHLNRENVTIVDTFPLLPTSEDDAAD